MAEERILIGVVDDHPQTATSISGSLDYAGYRTFEAYNGRDAIDMAKKMKPALLISDIVMEGIDGYAIAKELKTQKIIFITAYPVNRVKLTGLKNVVGVLTKPVSPEQVVKAVQKALKK